MPADAELSLCFNDVRDDPDMGVVILTGKLICRLPTYCLRLIFCHHITCVLSMHLRNMQVLAIMVTERSYLRYA